MSRLIDADKLKVYHGVNVGKNYGGLRAIVFKRDIDNAPTVEPKTGHWVLDEEFIDCSACRHEKWSRTPYEDLVKRFRYCPNCGAKMEV